MKQKLLQIEDLEIQIQDRFMKFKKAEQDFLEVLTKVDDEEKLIKVMEKLKEIDSRIGLIKKPTEKPTQRSYIG